MNQGVMAMVGLTVSKAVTLVIKLRRVLGLKHSLAMVMNRPIEVELVLLMALPYPLAAQENT